MPIRIVRLGSERRPDEGVRVGTVRRPPRGVPKTEYAARNWYDVWYPELSPSPETVKLALAAQTPADRARFERRYRREMAEPPAARTLDLLAALSADSHFSVGCYCEDPARCHRTILGALLREHGAQVIDENAGR